MSRYILSFFFLVDVVTYILLQAGSQGTTAQQPDLSLPLRPSSRTTSAPTSPAKSRESLLQRVSSLTSNVVSRATSLQQQPVETGKLAYNRDRCFTLLVVDDQNTDWYIELLTHWRWNEADRNVMLPDFFMLKGQNTSEAGGFTTTGMFESSRRNSVSYPSRLQPRAAPPFPWLFIATAPKSSGASLIAHYCFASSFLPG